jgi:hypothetical protein
MHDSKTTNQKKGDHMNSFNIHELSPLLGQLCAIKVIFKKDRYQYIGIGRLAMQEQKLTVFFECAVHLKKKKSLWPWASMKALGTIDNFVLHFQTIGVDLKPGHWQRIMTDTGDIFLSFQEKEILGTDAFTEFVKKNHPQKSQP